MDEIDFLVVVAFLPVLFLLALIQMDVVRAQGKPISRH